MKIRNESAYFAQVIRNADKNTYRSNDRQAEHIIVDSTLVEQSSGAYTDDMILEKIAEKSVENWLLTIENEVLHAGLLQLRTADQKFLFLLLQNKFSLSEMARINGITQQAASKRFLRIKKCLKNFLEKGCEK